jgi:hypothetical protein
MGIVNYKQAANQVETDTKIIPGGYFFYDDFCSKPLKKYYIVDLSTKI